MFCGYGLIEVAHDTKWKIYGELFNLRYQSLLQIRVTDRSGGCFALRLSLEPRVWLVGRYILGAASTGLHGLTPGDIPERTAKHSVQTGHVHTG